MRKTMGYVPFVARYKWGIEIPEKVAKICVLIHNGVHTQKHNKKKYYFGTRHEINALLKENPEAKKAWKYIENQAEKLNDGVAGGGENG